MKKERGNISGIKDAINDMLHDYHLESKFQATVVKSSWEEIMGKTIASRTHKISLYKKILKVEIDSAPLKNELNMSKTKVMTLLEKKFGKGVIEEIKFI